MSDYKHKPVLNDISFIDNFMENDFIENYHEYIKKWSPVLMNNFIFKETGINNLSFTDKKYLYTYIEWLFLHDESNLSYNLESLGESYIKLLNSDNLNFEIISELYNPVIKKIRYKVKSGKREFIIDDMYKHDEPLLIELYPDDFLSDIGAKQYVREKKLDEILDIK